MRTEVADGSAGYFHEAGFYASDAEFHAMIVPFVEEGVAGGEPVVLCYDERKSEQLRSWLGEPPGVTYAAGNGLYATPARAIAAFQGLIERTVAAGAPRVRLTGGVPHPGNGGCFEGWDRYEFALNTVWARFPARSLCMYDAATVPDGVRDLVERAHPHILTGAGEHRTNNHYEGLAANPHLPVPADPLEASAPTAELSDPSAAEARHVLERTGRGRVSDRVLDELLIGISEGVTNARLHGVPPILVTIWAAHDRVVATVKDQGDGPTDLLAGLVPTSKTMFGTGLGLWVTHLLDIDAALVFAKDGFSLRLRAGATPAPVSQ
ncbi:Anti-sigma regulatory factor (Ser/Thr protein kinase) [Actinopolymorpha cephalotaxi]|uniref:Anti-sigma regulatory factor (Ser/Thr protein kinase) n=1 Tax=Actinopolymorpha cephalotaxi TaxID=504797 RepID=A0A1I2XBV4_9ACTN|nr:sensor histidine kinase [Actinopolymorpha cephalotaxi]NYH86102.1 hypothetical protein [Actinopolymorpha cephalotaxi]SFH09491.1 Anti-sigma regulatory factor (Ser/Thr protein kinase) [Actinopolymorpha cephalotaxi]